MVRRVVVAGVALALTAVACGTQEEGTAETTLPPPTTITTTTVPSITTTRPPPATPSTTDPVETTATTTPTTAPAGPLTFDFAIVRSEDNPALDDGEPGDWDDKWAFAPWVVHRDGLYHLFYAGWGNAGLAIGYATSGNGLDFEEHADNPIVDLQPGDDGAVDAGRAVVRVGDDRIWEM